MSSAGSMAASAPPARNSSLRYSAKARRSMDCSDFSTTSLSDFSLHRGVRDPSDRSMSARPRRSVKTPELGSTARDMGMRRFDGAARGCREWDGLRRDPELWFPEGNCLVHLYGRGQSRRGPAFRVPMDALLTSRCRPLLNRFLITSMGDSPISETSSSEDGGYFGQPGSGKYELYIPASETAERGQAFLYHTATRNFFAWIFGKSLVGSHLGGALVGLLNSMNEFRTDGLDNIQAMMDYMDEEGYADLRNSPDHALGVLFFAEHFRFKDMWVDAFAHCIGMHDKLASRAGFEYMSRTSRALISRSRLEMDMRLEHAGWMLGSFLSDDLSDAHLGLSVPARAHLDKFRSFLQSFYVAKLGYYPPAAAQGSSTAFPMSIYRQMCQDFQKLYDYLVDSDFTSADTSPASQQGGICVLQSVQSFDSRRKYPSLQYPLPRLPEGEDAPAPKVPIHRRFSWSTKYDKMKPDPRLVTFASLTKATNRGDQSLLDCNLVRAYRGFEKECVFSPVKADKNERLSQTDARKVRWILVYSVYQTLLSATKIPKEVRDKQNVSYNLCVLTAGCPPWKDNPPYNTLIRTQTDQAKEDFIAACGKAPQDNSSYSPSEIKPDVDYFALTHRPQLPKTRPASLYSVSSIGAPNTLNTSRTRKGTIRRALSSLGNMPELRHPTPKKPIYHEILVHGYGNGTNTVITGGRSSPVMEEDEEEPRKQSIDSGSGSAENLSSRWSNSSMAEGEIDSTRTSISAYSQRDADSIKKFLDQPMTSPKMAQRSSSCYSESIYEDALQPNPLQVKKEATDGFMKVTTEVKVEWEDITMGKANEELAAYLNA